MKHGAQALGGGGGTHSQLLLDHAGGGNGAGSVAVCTTWVNSVRSRFMNSRASED